MKIVTQRDLIRNVVKRWEETFSCCFHDEANKDKFKIYEKLKLLNLEKATAKKIDNIIGNNFWTTKLCQECMKYKSTIIILGEEEDYESCTAYFCPECFEKEIEQYKTFKESLVQTLKKRRKVDKIFP